MAVLICTLHEENVSDIVREMIIERMAETCTEYCGNMFPINECGENTFSAAIIIIKKSCDA